MTRGRGIIPVSLEPECDLDHANVLSFDQLLFVTHNCMSGSAKSDAGLAPGSVSTGPCHEAPTYSCAELPPAQCVSSDGCHWPGWWLRYSNHGPLVGGQCRGKYWSVIASPADTAPPCHQGRAHPSWDLRSRVTARWFLSPTALHYHSHGLGISQRRVMSGVNMGYQGLTASDCHGHWPLDDEGLTQWCQPWGAGTRDIQ